VKAYWQFYWPLALTGLAMVLSIQFQNATLARYPDATREIAILALALSVEGFFRAGLQFIAQLTNVFARSPANTRTTFRFVCTISTIIMLMPLAIATLPFGAVALRTIFNIDAVLVEQVREYMTYLSLLIPLSALRFYYNGLLIQAQLTGWVTILNVLYLSTIITGLIIGFTVGGKPVQVLVGAEAVAVIVHLITLKFAHALRYTPPAIVETETVTWNALIRFFLPVSTTGVMFALSRPILYAFVARTPEGIVSIAAMRVAFDFTMMFQQAANQFRNFFITFGLDDLRRKQMFMIIIGSGITLIMVLFAFTPLSNLLWRDLMAIPEAVRSRSTEVLMVMCLMPAVIVYRNYFHGRMMVQKRTSGMAYGAMLRVVGIYIVAQLLFSAGWLNHATAGIVLILGFVLETVVVMEPWSKKARPHG
jgi:hypothetical protein